jgi:hypothetical protein
MVLSKSVEWFYCRLSRKPNFMMFQPIPFFGVDFFELKNRMFVFMLEVSLNNRFSHRKILHLTINRKILRIKLLCRHFNRPERHFKQIKKNLRRRIIQPKIVPEKNQVKINFNFSNFLSWFEREKNSISHHKMSIW